MLLICIMKRKEVVSHTEHVKHVRPDEELIERVTSNRPPLPGLAPKVHHSVELDLNASHPFEKSRTVRPSEEMVNVFRNYYYDPFSLNPSRRDLDQFAASFVPGGVHRSLTQTQIDERNAEKYNRERTAANDGIPEPDPYTTWYGKGLKYIDPTLDFYNRSDPNDYSNKVEKLFPSRKPNEVPVYHNPFEKHQKEIVLEQGFTDEDDPYNGLSEVPPNPHVQDYKIRQDVATEAFFNKDVTFEESHKYLKQWRKHHNHGEIPAHDPLDKYIPRDQYDNLFARMKELRPDVNDGTITAYINKKWGYVEPRPITLEDRRRNLLTWP